MTMETLKRNSKQSTKKIAPPFTSLPTKFKTRFYGPASFADIGGFHAISGDTNNNGEMNKCWWTNKAS